MRRDEILRALLPERTLPLWTPLLTPYHPAEGIDVDVDRLRTHAVEIAPHSSLWMIAGSTGDGWELSDDQFLQLLRAALDPGFVPEGARVLIALLRPTTEAILEAVDQVHRVLGSSEHDSFEENLERLRARRAVGLCLCPPVGEHVDQTRIALHVEMVLRHARMPVALYQLPQVTHCRIEPLTFDELAAAHPEIILFKDSSGEDVIARETRLTDGPFLVRGAENAYADSLKALGGRYDGLLLSTANVFAEELRALLVLAHEGEEAEARRRSEVLEARIARLFSAAEGLPAGNAFANVNRAVRHLRVHGSRWRDAEAPLLFEGSRLPMGFLERIEAILGSTLDG